MLKIREAMKQKGLIELYDLGRLFVAERVKVEFLRLTFQVRLHNYKCDLKFPLKITDKVLFVFCKVIVGHHTRVQ